MQVNIALLTVTDTRTLINGNGAPPIGPVDIVIEKNIITKIVTVGYPGVKINQNKRPVLNKGGKEINASDMYILPGFIDMHAHIGGISQGADWDYVFNLWLAHGVTTVREVGGRGRDWTLDLKKRSKKNLIMRGSQIEKRWQTLKPLHFSPILGSCSLIDLMVVGI